MINRLQELNERRIEIADKAYKDWVATEQLPKEVKLQANIERVNNFVGRESLRRSMDFNFDERILRERIVGPTNDIKDVPPNELARKRGVPVARLHEVADGVQPSGFGTGFLIAPNLLITNHHVFPSIVYAENCAANFLHEKDIAGRVLQGITFSLRPDIFFYNFEELDFALVYVDSNPVTGTQKLDSLGFLPLIATKGKVVKDRSLSIIQYPLGEYKKYAFEQNVVTEIDDVKGIIQYTTDTQPAASGSPCFNEAWEVAALHYTGVPFKVNGQWMTKTGKVWDRRTMSDDEINWIANAGKSISKIVAHLGSLQLVSSQQKYIDTILRNASDPLLPSAQTSSLTEAVVIQKPDLMAFDSKTSTMGNIILNFNAPANVYFNPPQVTAPANEVARLEKPAEQIAEIIAVEKKLRFDEDYANKKGYDENFLIGFTVPVPFVKHRKGELFKQIGENEPFIVKYHHYSLVVNKKRRFQMWSAVNVNYSRDVRDNRDRSAFGDDSKAWRIDPRVPEKYQVQAEEFYDPATLIDKGHIVRRDDNVWGENGDALQIEYGNSDTFHWLNCTPQHEQFNRDMFGVHGLWGMLENAIKEQLNDPENQNKDFSQKACVLAGPVLDDDDPEYNDIQYPLKFWKIFAIVSESEGPLVYGFILDQKQVVDEFGLEKEARPRFGTKVRALQASLADIEQISGVSFDPVLHAHDVKAGTPLANESLRPDLSNFVYSKKYKGNGVEKAIDA